MSAGFRSRWPSAWITACSVALLAGCGGDDRIDRGAADRLARQSSAVAASLARDDGCQAAARLATLRRDARAAMADGRVPARFQPQLRAALTRLQGEIVCTPPPPPQPAAHEEDEGDEEPGNGNGKGKGHGREKGKGKGKGK